MSVVYDILQSYSITKAHVMKSSDLKKFQNLGYKDFEKMAKDCRLSQYEKIGFPDEYRQGKEKAIYHDIISKIPSLQNNNKCILDIGPGCSDLPHYLIDLCKINQHHYYLIDSQNMLDHLPDSAFIHKISGFFPNETRNFIQTHEKYFDAIIAYSIFHYIFVETNLWDFLDSCLMMMKEKSYMLIGDIPNISKRNRFFSSQSGIAFHKNFINDQKSSPTISFNQIEKDKIDDSVIFGILLRARNQGFDAYLLPQNENLPMSNRREDILIIKP